MHRVLLWVKVAAVLAAIVVMSVGVVEVGKALGWVSAGY